MPYNTNVFMRSQKSIDTELFMEIKRDIQLLEVSISANITVNN